VNLYIISRGRAGKMLTHKSIPSQWRGKTYIVCPATELQEYKTAYPYWPMLASEAANYSEKVQEVLGRIPGKGVILDDDLWFDQRVGDKLVKLDDVEQLNSMFATMERYLDEVPLVSVHPRMMGHQAPLPYKEVGKVVCVQGVNIDLFPDGQVPKVDYCPILADVFLNCYLLSHGLPNRLITEFVMNWGPSQAAGGCDYRTIEMQAEATALVAEMYGPYAKQVWKKAKQENWLGKDGRPDLRVQWQKLYRDAPNA